MNGILVFLVLSILTAQSFQHQIPQSLIQKTIKHSLSNFLAQERQPYTSRRVMAQLQEEVDDVVKESYTLWYYNFTMAEEAQALSWFNDSDVDGNLTLDTSEVQGAFSDIGLSACGAKIFVQMVDGYFGHQYRDAVMGKNEFYVVLQIFLSTSTDQGYWFFKAIDVDQSGYVDESEWGEAVMALKSTYAVDFDSVDTDGDDGISSDEFLTLLGIDPDGDSGNY